MSNGDGRGYSGGGSGEERDSEETRNAAEEQTLEAVKRLFETGSRARIDDLIDPQAQKVLRLRCGVEDGERCTLGAIGIELGLEADSVAAIARKALRKLREGGLLSHD